MSNYKLYCDCISEIMCQNDNGFTSNYHFCVDMASAQIAFGDKKAGEAIQAKVNGIATDYANGLIVKLMGSYWGYVNGCTQEFVRSYLYHEYTASQFVEACINDWGNSDRECDREFMEDILKAWNDSFSQLSKTLYCTAADKLVASMKS